MINIVKKWWEYENGAPHISYYSLTDFSAACLLVELKTSEHNLTQIIKTSNSYEDLLKQDFSVGFMVLSLFWWDEDAKKSENYKINASDLYLEYIELADKYVSFLKQRFELKNFDQVTRKYQFWLVENIACVVDYIRTSKVLALEDVFRVFNKKVYLNSDEINELCDYLDMNFTMYYHFLLSNNKTIKKRFENQMHKIQLSLLKNFDFSTFNYFLNLLPHYYDGIKQNRLKKREFINDLKELYWKLENGEYGNNGSLLFAQSKIKQALDKNGLKDFIDLDIEKSFSKEQRILFENPNLSFSFNLPTPEFDEFFFKKLINKDASIFWNETKKTSFSVLERRDWWFNNNFLNGSKNEEIEIVFDIFNQWVLLLNKNYLENLAKRFKWFQKRLNFPDKSNLYVKRISSIFNQFLSMISKKITDPFEWSDKSGTIFGAIDGILGDIYKHLCPEKTVDNFSSFFVINNGAEGSPFSLSNHFKNLLSDDAKKVIYYYLFIWNGNGNEYLKDGQRNIIVHCQIQIEYFMNGRAYLIAFQVFLRFLDELINNLITFVVNRLKDKFKVTFSSEQLFNFRINPILLDKFIGRIENKYKEWNMEFDFNVLDLLKETQ